MSERLAEWVIDVMGENWKTFRAHAPAGAYLPVGQLDGDCRECGAAWPCPTVTKIIEDGAATIKARKQEGSG